MPKLERVLFRCKYVLSTIFPSGPIPFGDTALGDSDSELKLGRRSYSEGLSKSGRGGLSFQDTLLFLAALSIFCAMNLHRYSGN